MHDKIKGHRRDPRSGRGGDKPAAARPGRSVPDACPQKRKRKDAENGSVNLLAHVCEVMGLFPRESELALAELVARIRSEKLTGAAAKIGRRAGPVNGARAKPRSRK
jgi:hypothetical protein